MTAASATTPNYSVLAPGLHPARDQATTQVPLVLLHGWGCDSRVWGGFAWQLNKNLNVCIIDLPGFGDNKHLACDIDQIQNQLPKRGFYLGWSLGGMVATQIAARYPERVAGLITLAANSQFVANTVYSAAMPVADFDNFSAGVDAQCATTLKRFCLLAGNGLTRGELGQLRDDYNQALNQSQSNRYLAGLKWLASIENSQVLKSLTMPSLHILARDDQLVPAAAAEPLQALVNQSPIKGEVKLVDGCHALFLRQMQVLVNTTEQFIESHKPLREKSRVAQSFANAANLYDQAADLQRRVGLDLWQYFAERDNCSNADTWLDLGSGTGYFSDFIQEQRAGAQVISADLSQGMLSYARAKNRGAFFAAADAEQLPFAHNSIDVVFSNLAIQWCENPAALISELKRVLKPKGCALIATLGPGTMNELQLAWQAVDDYRHVNRFIEPSAITLLAEQVGFGRVEHKSVKLTEYFDSLKTLFKSLKNVGAHNVNQGQPQGLSGRNKIQSFQQSYQTLRTARGYPLTYCVEYFLLTHD